MSISTRNLIIASLGLLFLGSCAYFLLIHGKDTNTQGNILPINSSFYPPRNSLDIEDMQIGLNFIRFYFGINDIRGELDMQTPFTQPGAIFADFDELGVDGYRQTAKVDLTWNNIEPVDNQWNFEASDSALLNSSNEPIVTLFAYQYASGTPPWAKEGDQFQKTIGTEARDYLTIVVQRYAPYVRYWEIGNEMDHWRVVEEGQIIEINGGESEKLPPNAEVFTPEEQGKFLAEAAQIIRENDQDAVILMPGMSSLDSYCTETWLGGVIDGGGSDWFDVINYHYYGSWLPYFMQRTTFTSTLDSYGIGNKPVWVTETGSTSTTTLTIRTNYPNSEESQAADIFRRIVQAYALGDSFVMWHTYIGSGEISGDWAGYGIITDKGEKKKSYYSFNLLTEELTPFESILMVSAGDPAKENIYRIVTESGETKYVAWGVGNFTIPAGITSMTSVVPDQSGNFNWQTVSEGDEIILGDYPVLLK